MLKDTLTTLHEEGDDNPYYQKVRTYVLNPKVKPPACYTLLNADFEHDFENFKPFLVRIKPSKSGTYFSLQLEMARTAKLSPLL